MVVELTVHPPAGEAVAVVAARGRRLAPATEVNRQMTRERTEIMLSILKEDLIEALRECDSLSCVCLTHTQVKAYYLYGISDKAAKSTASRPTRQIRMQGLTS